MPSIEKQNINNSNSDPMLNIAGNVTRKVWNMSLSDLFFLKILNILPILNDLMMVVYGPSWTWIVSDNTTPNIVIMTITISNMFHPSLKYLSPYPMILTMASSMKIAANT
jgi:hypothetical protein